MVRVVQEDESARKPGKLPASDDALNQYDGTEVKRTNLHTSAHQSLPTPKYSDRDRAHSLHHFFWKKLEIFDIPVVFAFFNFSTPCDAFASAFLFFPSSPFSVLSAFPVFFLDFVGGADATMRAAASAWMYLRCSSRAAKLDMKYEMLITMLRTKGHALVLCEQCFVHLVR